MQVYLTGLGCRLNEAELEQWARTLRDQGHVTVPQAGGAEMIVVNTCAVTAEAGRKSRKLLRSLHRKNPTAPLVVTGCYSELHAGETAAIPGVDLVVPNGKKDQLIEIVSDKLDLRAMPVMAKDPDSSHVYSSSDRTRAFIKVQDGCRNRCTFCIVTIARGNERSRPIGEIVGEVNQLHQAGHQEAVLTGVHLGGYGGDQNTDLFCLVETLLAETTIPRVRLSSLEPWDIPEHFWQLWANPRLMPHLHLPLQSGSDTVLKRMARRCDTASYQKLVCSARQRIPGLSITSDVIVGFPGETEQEWAETVDFVQSMEFAHIHIFSYSPRAGTKAATLTDRVPNQTQRQRSEQLHQIAARMKRNQLRSQVGQQRAVLWEGSGVSDGDQIRWSGYTDNYLRVETRVDMDQDLENHITSAHFTGVESGRLLATVVG